MTNKPQIHISMLDMMSRCGIQFQRRYGARFDCWHEEEILPPGIALVTGISVHKAVERNLKNKMETKSLLPRKEVASIAADSFYDLWDAGIMMTEDEAENFEKTRGTALDQTVKLSELHYDNLAPTIMPVAVEEKFVIHLNGYPYDLSGQKDIREKDCIRDTKTKATTPPEDAARTMQMAMYALSEKIERKKLPARVCIDFLIKTKTLKNVTREAVPDSSWITPLMLRVERATEIIQSVKEGYGQFTPADPESWVCSEKYCGYAHNCPFWSGK